VNPSDAILIQVPEASHEIEVIGGRLRAVFAGNDTSTLRWDDGNSSEVWSETTIQSHNNASSGLSWTESGWARNGDMFSSSSEETLQ
jgi:hypothetical protein